MSEFNRLEQLLEEQEERLLEKFESTLEKRFEHLASKMADGQNQYLNKTEVAEMFSRTPEWLRRYIAADLFLPGKTFRRQDAQAWSIAVAEYGVTWNSRSKSFRGKVDDLRQWLRVYKALRLPVGE